MGLAGLSAAVRLSKRGRKLALYEAAAAAGGRCRSYFDRELGCRVDNGNHLVLSGNRAVLSYLEAIGARGSLTGPGRALFPFVDLGTGERWVLRPNAGWLPWWVLCPGRRVPGTRLSEYRALLRLAGAAEGATVRGVVGGGALVRRLIDPLAVAALNCRPELGSAKLLGAVLKESLARGGAAALPLVPRVGLSESFVDPAIERLKALGAEVYFGRRVSAVAVEGRRVVGFVAGGERVAVGDEDCVVLAVPAPVAKGLVPGVSGPEEHEAILNVHFRVRAEPGVAGFVAVVGGLAEWVFVKPGIVSVTVSAAERVIDRPAEELAAEIWPEVCTALGLSGTMPPVRVVKERRATFAATPAQERLRPGARTAIENLVLAGDWTATGLPATIEGAIRSGERAAEMVCTWSRGR
ncbi:MAG TPA: hydroxysqualene dehydroxylase HpnE [Acetobacteraceae bacterium]|nr:hydroxysqualene dehydroxylase HpnE [Acetobacteraceae bacterium]